MRKNNTLSLNQSLIEKRKELKEKIDNGTYISLTTATLNVVGRLIQQITRRSHRVNYWYSSLLIMLTTYLLGLSVAHITAQSVSRNETIMGAWAVLVGIGTFMATHVVVDMLITLFREHAIDDMESMAGLVYLERWLENTINRKKQLMTTLLLGPALGLASLVIIAINRSEIVTWNQIVIAIIVGLQASIPFYYFFPAMVIPQHLSRYRFKLYPLNPSSSEIIDRISDLTTNFAYVFAVLAIIYSLGFLSFGRVTVTTTSLWLFLAIWGPLITIFANGHIGLSKMISQAKWITLKDIQAKIENLANQADVPSQETLAHIAKLVEYHDSIKNTPNSALNFRSSLNFLNSLLLPVIAFLLANIDKVIGLF